MDRSDEGSGSCIGGRRLADDSLVLDEPLDENERERAALWALAFVFLGIPATWAVKEAALRWFVACFGKEERGVERRCVSGAINFASLREFFGPGIAQSHHNPHI